MRNLTSQFSTLVIICLASSYSNAQSASEQRERIADVHSNAIKQPQIQDLTPPDQGSGGDKQEISSSDTGMQRPIFLKSKNFTIFGGVNNSLSRQQNPLTENTEELVKESGGHAFSWNRSVSGGFMTHPVDINFAMLSFVGGGSWGKTTHIRDIPTQTLLDNLSTSSYALAMIQHESGWSYRVGSTYAMTKDIKNTEETYREFYPMMGVSQTFDTGFDVAATIDISGGKHLTKTSKLITDGDHLDNWDYAVSLGLRYQLWDFQLSPSYSYTKKHYSTKDESESTRFKRVDHTNSLSFKLDYQLSESLSVGASYAFDQRDSNIADEGYKSWSVASTMGIDFSF